MDLKAGISPDQAKRVLIEINQGKCPFDLEPISLSNGWKIHLLPDHLTYVVSDPEGEAQGVHDDFSDAFTQAFCEERA